MPLVSISKAAKLAGISRQHLYKKYINPGQISVLKDGDNPPMIDTSELLRVFGRLQCDTEGDDSNRQPDDAVNIAVIEAELAAAKAALADRDAQLRDAQEREAKMWKHVEEVTGALRLLEDRSGQSEDLARQVADMKTKLEKATHDAARLKQELKSEQEKGFLARIFGR